MGSGSVAQSSTAGAASPGSAANPLLLGGNRSRGYLPGPLVYVLHVNSEIIIIFLSCVFFFFFYVFPQSTAVLAGYRTKVTAVFTVAADHRGSVTVKNTSISDYCCTKQTVVTQVPLKRTEQIPCFVVTVPGTKQAVAPDYHARYERIPWFFSTVPRIPCFFLYCTK